MRKGSRKSQVSPQVAAGQLRDKQEKGPAKEYSSVTLEGSRRRSALTESEATKNKENKQHRCGGKLGPLGRTVVKKNFSSRAVKDGFETFASIGTIKGVGQELGYPWLFIPRKQETYRLSLKLEILVVPREK